MTYNVYLDHKRDRQAKISQELTRFAVVNTVFCIFFLLMLIHYTSFSAPETVCSFEILVLAFFYSYEVFKQRTLLVQFCTNNRSEYVRQYLEQFPERQRAAVKLRIHKELAGNISQFFFYTLLFFFTVQINNERLIHSYVVLIPEGVQFLLVVFLSRWPENPCQSLMHLISCAGMFTKNVLICFILLKADSLIGWTWTSSFW